MSNGNNVTICGTLGRAPELRFTPSGQAVATFGVALNRRWQDRQTQEWKEDTDWIDVVAWGQLGENAAECLDKGTRVIVTGRFSQRTWETQDGDKRSKVEVVADEIGPSIKWATAVVTKNERRGDTGPADPYSGGTPAPASTAAAPPMYDPDEEPFVRDAGEWTPGAWGTYPESWTSRPQRTTQVRYPVMSADRIAAVRVDADGTRIPCTARVDAEPDGNCTVSDFRDADQKPLSLPPGSEFVIDLAVFRGGQP